MPERTTATEAELVRFYHDVLTAIGRLKEEQAQEVIKQCSENPSTGFNILMSYFTDPAEKVASVDKVELDKRHYSNLRFYKNNWAKYGDSLQLLAMSVAVETVVDIPQASGMSANLMQFLSEAPLAEASLFSRERHNDYKYPFRKEKTDSNQQNNDPDYSELKVIIYFVPFCAALVVGVMTAAALQLYHGTRERCVELANNQRVLSNLACLCLTAIAIAGVAALLASNPFGWAVGLVIWAAVTTYVFSAIGMALFGAALNATDEKLNRLELKDPILSTKQLDSRFQLTKDEEAAIRKDLTDKRMSPEKIEGQIAQVKLSIKELGEDLYATQKADPANAAPTKVTRQLAQLKKGILDDAHLGMSTSCPTSRFKFAIKTLQTDSAAKQAEAKASTKANAASEEGSNNNLRKR